MVNALQRKSGSVATPVLPYGGLLRIRFQDGNGGT